MTVQAYGSIENGYNPIPAKAQEAMAQKWIRRF
jgi:hypothetical protein